MAPLGRADQLDYVLQEHRLLSGGNRRETSNVEEAKKRRLTTQKSMVSYLPTTTILLRSVHRYVHGGTDGCEMVALVLPNSLAFKLWRMLTDGSSRCSGSLYFCVRATCLCTCNYCEAGTGR